MYLLYNDESELNQLIFMIYGSRETIWQFLLFLPQPFDDEKNPFATIIDFLNERGRFSVQRLSVDSKFDHDEKLHKLKIVEAPTEISIGPKLFGKYDGVSLISVCAVKMLRNCVIFCFRRCLPAEPRSSYRCC